MTVVKTAPSASISPAGPMTICASNTPTTISAVTNGVSPSYLWQKDGSAISPAQTGSNLSVSESGSYTVVVTADGCSTESAAFALTVTPNVEAGVSIAITSGTQTICAQNPVTFTATPTNGGSNPTYQWLKNITQ